MLETRIYTGFSAFLFVFKETIQEVIRDYPIEAPNVKTEISKTKIYISTGETEILKFLIKELVNHAEYR